MADLILVEDTLIEMEPFNTIIHSEEFYYEELLSLFQKYKDYNIDTFKSKLTDFINNPLKDFKFQKLLEDSEVIPEYQNFLLLIGKMIAISDSKGYNKQKWNPYIDKRVLSKANFTQKEWTFCFFKFKINNLNFDELNPITHGAFLNAIRFIENPISNVNITSSPHRKLITGHYGLKSENEILNLFPEYTSKVKNNLNKGVLITNILYGTNEKNRWQNTEELDNNKKTEPKNPTKTMSNYPLNLILYGPPGTGKTYNTIDRALQIIHGKEFLKDKEREELVNEFDRLKESKQIEFVTFHQSFSYEDFIEGIKPVIRSEDEENDTNGNIKYEIRDGIFKSLCNVAKGASKLNRKVHTDISVEKATFYKMSLGGKQKLHIHDWCIKNGRVALGFGEREDHSPLKPYIGNWKEFRDQYERLFPNIVKESKFNIQGMYYFMKMKTGDVVIATKGNRVIDAIGIIKNDNYIFEDTHDFEYCQFRDVEWIATDLNASPDLFVKKNISQQSIYEFYDEDINKSYFLEEFASTERDNEEKRFVLIIDEINRGNVASIFGELITLIEEDKRIGKPNRLLTKLPYSGSKSELFGVPSNLYIIGTMNTADRSVEALDSALRRRFDFEETPPRYDLEELEYKYEGFKANDILKVINDRIELLLDKNHLIGHSYFIKKKDEDAETKLKNSFYKNIIPLLQEYFFGDYSKIGLILGKGFVKKENKNNQHTIFADFDSPIAQNYDEKDIYRIIQTENFADAINQLMKRTNAE